MSGERGGDNVVRLRTVPGGEGTGEFTDSWRALTDAMDLLEDLQQLSRRPEDFTAAEVATLDARVEEMRRRVEAINGTEDVRA